MLKRQSSPTKERRPAILGPRNTEDRGNHSVGTMPVTRRTEGPKSHIGHLRGWCSKGGWFFISITSSSPWKIGIPDLSSASMASTILLPLMIASPSSVVAYGGVSASQGKRLLRHKDRFFSPFLWKIGLCSCLDNLGSLQLQAWISRIAFLFTHSGDHDKEAIIWLLSACHKVLVGFQHAGNW